MAVTRTSRDRSRARNLWEIVHPHITVTWTGSLTWGSLEEPNNFSSRKRQLSPKSCHRRKIKTLNCFQEAVKNWCQKALGSDGRIILKLNQISTVATNKGNLMKNSPHVHQSSHTCTRFSSSPSYSNSDSRGHSSWQWPLLPYTWGTLCSWSQLKHKSGDWNELLCKHILMFA